MEVTDFSDKAGQLLGQKDIRGNEYFVFVPKNLPPLINFDNELVFLLSEADRKISELSGVGSTLPNPELLITPYINSEALFSSRIEGTHLSIPELYLSKIQKPAEKDPDAIDVNNYVAMIRMALSKPQNIDLDLIKKMHKVLFSGKPTGYDEEPTPGQFKTLQNHIGIGYDLKIAKFVPAPPQMVPDLMVALEKYMQDKNNLPPLIKAALIHHQFESIHPFCNGNGRIGRALVTVYLCKKGVLKQPLLYLSAFFEKYRSEYEYLLLKVNKEGCFEEWIKFFLRGVQIQSEDALHRAKKLQDLREQYRQISDKTEVLFYWPFITVSKAAKCWKVTYPTAKSIVHDLVNSNVLTDYAQKPRNTIYCAKEILSVLDIDKTMR